MSSVAISWNGKLTYHPDDVDMFAQWTKYVR